MFYDVFVNLCQEKRCTPADVRKDLGISQSTMASWKSRGLTPRYEMLKKLADYFDVDINWLVSGQTLEQRDQGMKDYVARRFTEVELGQRLQASYDVLNLDGKEKAVDSIEIIAGNPAYRKPKTPPEDR